MVPIEAWLRQAGAHRARTGRPLVSLCYAQSLDGSLAQHPGQPLELSCRESSLLTHRLRAAHDGILVGVGAVLNDDPRLTVRLVDGSHPQPVVLDSHLRTPPDARLLTDHPLRPWIATIASAEADRKSRLQAAGARLLEVQPDPQGKVRLEALLERLAELGLNTLMVEGGATVIASFLAEGLADLAVITIAPLFVGGLHVSGSEIALTSGRLGGEIFPRLVEMGVEKTGDDLSVWGKIAYA